MGELLIRYRKKIKKGLLFSGILAGISALIILGLDLSIMRRVVLCAPWILGLPLFLSHFHKNLSDVQVSNFSLFIWLSFVLSLTFFEETYLGWIWSLVGCVGVIMIKKRELRLFLGGLFLLLNCYHSLNLFFINTDSGGYIGMLWRHGILIYGVIHLTYSLLLLIRQVIVILKEKEREYLLFKDILDNIPSDIVAINKEKKHVYVNHTAIKNPEVREFMIGRTIYDYCEFRNKPIEMAIKRDEYINKAFSSDKEVEWEETFPSPKGILTYIRRLSPVKNEAGETKFIIAYGIDISDRKKAEAEVKSNQAIQQSINYFAKSLFGQNTEEDIVWDIAQNCIQYLGFDDCVIYLLDPQKQTLVQKAAFGSKSTAERQILNPLEIPIGQGIVGKAALTGSSKLIYNTQEEQDYIVDDQVRMSEIAVPIIGPEGILGVIDSENSEIGFYTQQHLEILEVIASICANKLIKARADKALIESKEKAEEATRAKSSFLSTMSHEIRTPMNAVIGISHLLLEDNPLENQLPSLKTLQFSAKHLLSLINDILDYSKIEAGKLAFEQQEFNLGELLDNLKSTFSFKSLEKQLDLIKDIPIPLENYLIGDWVRLNQILTNLLGNALKFTSEGSVRFGFKVLSNTEKEIRLHFFVKDSGIGIEEDKIATIFNQFTQASTQTTRKYGGTGLGLAICKRLVELQGGEIGLESTLGEGTTFWFSMNFPLGKRIHGGENPKLISNWTEQTLKGMKVLLVEDNKVNVMVAKKFLQKWEIEVDVAENGQLAYEKVQTKTYQLVLMDLNMPVMDGISSTKLIRQLPKAEFQDLPIIALTADISENVKEDILACGMNDYLTKPFAPEKLFQSLKSYYLLSPKPRIN